MCDNCPCALCREKYQSDSNSIQSFKSDKSASSRKSSRKSCKDFFVIKRPADKRKKRPSTLPETKNTSVSERKTSEPAPLCHSISKLSLEESRSSKNSKRSNKTVSCQTEYISLSNDLRSSKLNHDEYNACCSTDKELSLPYEAKNNSLSTELSTVKAETTSGSNELWFKEETAGNEVGKIALDNLDKPEICVPIHLELKNISQEDSSITKEIEKNSDVIEDYKHPEGATNDDFETYILDENEENYIVEAYNNVGNELIITFLEISRKSSNLLSYCNEVENGSTMVFHKEENDSTYKEILNHNDTLPECASSGQNSKEDNTQNLNKEYSTFLQHLHKKLLKNNENDASESGTSQHFETENCDTLGNLVHDAKFSEPNEESSSISNGSLHPRELQKKESSKRTSGYESGSSQDDIQQYFENSDEDGEYVAMRRSTVCDESGNVRIEKFSSVEDPDFQSSESSFSISRKESVKTKIDFIVEELIETEEKYVQDLEKVVKDYKPFIEHLGSIYKHLQGKASYIFGNISDIYESSRKFYDDLKARRHSINDIGRLFVNSKSTFQLYHLYSKNKPKSDQYVKEFQVYINIRQELLGDRLGLSSYLLTPVQRLGKYILLVEKILKCPLVKNTETEQIFNEALDILKSEMRKGNDSIAIDSIRRCPVDLSQHGAFLRREKFVLLKPRKMEIMVFLFEEIIVFTSIVLEVSEVFIYLESIYLADLSIACFENHPTVFHLSDFPKNKTSVDKRYTFVLEAKNYKIKEQWTGEIERLLWKQLEKCKDEIHQHKNSEHTGFIKLTPKGTRKSLTGKKSGRFKKNKSKFYTTM